MPTAWQRALAGALTGDWAGSLLGASTSAALTDAASVFARQMDDALSRQRMQQALELLGKTTPDAPARPLSPFVATTPGAARTPVTGMGQVPVGNLMESLKRLDVMQ
jgi:hypothetical protein